MLLENQMISVKISKRNLEWYFSKGYECNKGDEIWVRAEDLTEGNNKYVYVKCDYCGCIVEKKYDTYVMQNKRTFIERQIFCELC